MRRLPCLLGLVTVSLLWLTDAGNARAPTSWTLDPNYTICTPRADWIRNGTVPLCAGKRMIFHTPGPSGPVGLVIPETTGFWQFGNGRSGILDFRITFNPGNGSYTSNRIRFRTSDSGRHWRLLRNVRVESEPGRKEIKFKVATGPCTWRNFTHKDPRRLGGFGNTCFPFGLLGSYYGGWGP